MKILSSFILSFISIIGFGQTILYQPESVSRTVQDPQTVVLAQGFHATSSVSNPFVAKIGPATENPGGGPTDSQAGANNPSGTTAPSGQSFHDTRGNIDITGTGQLQYTLPVPLPPGIKNVAPQVNLVYTSGSGNGIAGYGWNISGITSISRSGKNIEKDGEVKGIQLDYSDYYSFNGQRLILKLGEYGKDGAEYVTEKYSNIKIKSVGAVTGQAWQGPEYWEVTFEDGSQAWYGATSSGSSEARTPVEYNIVKWKDAQGNYISYHYMQTKNVAVISAIEWGGNQTLGKLHFNEILFNYISRDLKEQTYINGTSFIQERLLSNIIVNTNASLFKKYFIEYGNNGTNYQFVNKVTEYNSENTAANPVIFSYPNLVSSQVDYYGVLPYNSDSFDNVRLTGDFNGDSYLDFIMSNGTIKLGAFNDAYQEVSTNKIFNADAKVVNTLLDEEGQIYNGNGIVQYENNTITGYIFRNNTFVKIFEKPVQPVCVTCTNTATINEGDVNGDGISDIFLTLISGAFVDRYIIDLKNSNTPVSTYSGGFAFNENSYTNQKYMDVDGDGKVEIINISNTDYTVFEFVKTSPTQYLKKIKYTESLSETKDPNFPVLFGDFNGDGNLDFTIPVTDNQSSDNWRFYLGTENGFQNTLKTNFLKYRKPAETSPLALIDYHFYSISDINKDGKSDIVFIYSKNSVGAVGTSGNALWRTLQYEVKTMLANGGTDFINGFNTTSPSYNVGGAEYGLFQPLTYPIKSNNNYYDIFIFKNTRVHKYRAQTSLAELSRIQSINQAGVTTSVKYLEVISDNTTNPDFYKKTKKEFYPYFSLPRADQSFIVAQFLQEGKKQDFRYRGMTGHMQGKGMVGYYQTARSSWYADGFENTKIWSGVEIDPLNEGVPVKEWAIRTNDEAKIFPADISENNAQLLSFKSTTYQTDKLLNGQVVTTINDADKPKVVTAIIPKSNLSKDFLTNTVTSGTITYGEYYLPSQSVSNVNNNYAVTTSTFDYIHNISGTGSDYYIGRPKSKTDVIQAYGDTKSAKQEYTYENNLLKTLKTWNRDNTGYLQETYTYDGFGNITQKIVSNSTDSQTQTETNQYEPKGRFVIKKTDNLGLETNIEYNDWGQIKKQIDPLGNTLVNTYDSWGKILTSKTNLEGTTTYQYERDNNSNIIVTQYNADGDVSKKFTNKLGQEYKVSTKAFGQGQFVSKETQYDVLSRKIAESEPYFDGQSANNWNIIAYDDSVFPSKVTATAFNSKQIETTVSGLITTVKELNGYGRITSKTNDVLGNVVSSTDKGGTIQFTYNAAGEQIKAQYAENIVTTKYDVWGRKSEFNDPSNGTYKYEYDGFGQPKKITSPKGTKEYTYNNLGQLISQRELSTTDGGQATDKTITYTYDDKGRVTSRSGTSKGKAYSSNVVYDPQGRLLSSSESSNGKYYIQKGITYDDMGRVISYEKSLYSSGVLTKVNIENIYSTWNGELSQVKDKNSGKVLWSLIETNAKGQILRANLGKSKIYNTYDGNGFLTEIDHQHWMQLQGTPSILQINYTFDAIKNELKSRNTLGDFNILEEFDYDDNNRLVNWTNPVTGIKPTSNRNVYDVKGRILENDQVGTIKFENPAKVYQATGMTLNAAGTQNYNNDLIQSIAYNENNDPVFIDGEKGDVAFQYGLSSMRQRVTYGGNFSIDNDGKFTKFYSEDGSFEILKDNVTGKEKHILYIGGTPYASNIIYLKNYDDATGSYKFLHKDYLGSILAISDEDGNKLEQRHFDAWGNFTHLQIGNGPIITDKNIINTTSLLVDRGYTSHEHFAEVGIIHMNGRLYDPLLRRFLNADENIQDSYNTQNYNKYGYVLNNPLMFNDPSGEIWEAGLLLTFLAYAIPAAAIGIAVAVTVYTVQAFMNNNWSLEGFTKSILFGAVTGFVSGGLGHIFTAGGFWTIVANGALAGAGSGGVTALLTGQNFIEGLAKGAVMGGAVAGLGWVVGKTVTYYRSKTPNTITSTELENAGYDLSDTSFDDYYTTDKQVQNDFNLTTGDYQASVDNINTEYKVATSQNIPKGFSLTDRHQIWTDNPKEDGYVLGITTNRNKNLWEFLVKGQKSSVLIAPNLGLKSNFLKQAVFGHEYIHAYHRYIGLMAKYGKKYSDYTESSAYHFSINLLKHKGQDYSAILNQFYNYGAKFPGVFNWTAAINNIVNFKK
ncbi:hypothetical protein CHRYSEOSP005_04250 [Chryseobacterium sp. Alg-005]|uniref:RHS repeat-associated core domain-containing protein n=1 Tax=Chryseobacterium sp. Alg-005 TaxID=3159516 RepID=UPI0035556953